MNTLEDTTNEIELESARLALENNQPLVQDTPVADEVEGPVPMSPRTKLRQKMQARRQRMLYNPSQNVQPSQIRKEMIRYELLSILTKAVDVLRWWRDHKKVLPCLAKHVLTIPASSANSERVKENMAKVEVF